MNNPIHNCATTECGDSAKQHANQTGACMVTGCQCIGYTAPTLCGNDKAPDERSAMLWTCTRVLGHKDSCALVAVPAERVIDETSIDEPTDETIDITPCGYVNCKHGKDRHTYMLLNGGVVMSKCSVAGCQCWQFEKEHKEPTIPNLLRAAEPVGERIKFDEAAYNNAKAGARKALGSSPLSRFDSVDIGPIPNKDDNPFLSPSYRKFNLSNDETKACSNPKCVALGEAHTALALLVAKQADVDPIQPVRFQSVMLCDGVLYGLDTIGILWAQSSLDGEWDECKMPVRNKA